MTSALEQLVLDGLSLNDLVTLVIEPDTFSFKPAQKQAEWVDNPDADGAELADEPHYTNSEFNFTVRVLPQASMDAALEEHGAVIDKLQKAARMRDQGGLPMLWTPAGSTRTYTVYVKLGELTDLPITPTGDLAGWFLKSPLLPCKLTCRPFLEREERLVLAPVTSELPVQVVELKEVDGDVDALGRLIFTDKATQNRRHIEWGLDQGEGSLLITAASFVTTGYSGSATTRSGAYSAEKVVRATAVGEWTTIASTAALALLGSYRPKIRVYAGSAATRFRATYRVGDGPWKSLVGVQPAVVGNWCELDLGEISVEAVANGTQRLEVRIDHKATEGAPANDVNYLLLMPTLNGWGKGRGLAPTSPSKLLGYDQFEQPAGNLEGLNLGGPGAITWAGASKTGANGFKVNESQHMAYRSTVSDADGNSGAYAIAGSTKYTSCLVSLDEVRTEAAYSSGGEYRLGVLARYIDTNNWLMAVVYGGNGDGTGCFKLIKRVAGTVAPLVQATSAGGTSLLHSHALTLEPLANGTWSASVTGSRTDVYSGFDADLAVGGALAEGKVGIYDAWARANACTRWFDGFRALGTDPVGVACYSGRAAEVRSDRDDRMLRQDSTGTYYGPPSTYRGDRLYIPPAGDAGQIARLAVKARRNDVDLEPDSNVTDKQQVEVRVTERFLAPR